MNHLVKLTLMKATPTVTAMTVAPEGNQTGTIKGNIETVIILLTMN